MVLIHARVGHELPVQDSANLLDFSLRDGVLPRDVGGTNSKVRSVRYMCLDLLDAFLGKRLAIFSESMNNTVF